MKYRISSKTRLFFQEYTNKTMIQKQEPEVVPQLFEPEETTTINTNNKQKFFDYRKTFFKSKEENYEVFKIRYPIICSP